MARQVISHNQRSPESNESKLHGTGSRPNTAFLENDALIHTAQQIAQGSMPFPDGLASEELQRLVARVQALRRERLVRFIARAIADDIRRSGH